MTKHRPDPAPRKPASAPDDRRRPLSADEAPPGPGTEEAQAPPRPHVMAAYRRSLEKYAALYEKLAQ